MPAATPRPHPSSTQPPARRGKDPRSRSGRRRALAAGARRRRRRGITLLRARVVSEPRACTAMPPPRAGAPPASPPSTPCLHRRRATTEMRPYPQSPLDVVVFAAPTCAPRRSRSTTTAPSGRPPHCLLLVTVRHCPCLDGLRRSYNHRGHVLAVLHVEPPPAITSSPRHGSTSPCTASSLRRHQR